MSYCRFDVAGLAEREVYPATARRDIAAGDAELLDLRDVDSANDAVTCAESTARPRKVEGVNVVVPPASSSSTGPLSGPPARRSCPPIRSASVSASSFRSVKSAPGQLLETARELRADLAIRHLRNRRRRVGNRAPASVESTSDALVCQNQLVRRAAAALERERARQRTVEARSSSSHLISSGAAKRRGLSDATLPLAE